MKITSLEVIFWFPLKSFSSLKCILLSVLTVFLLCFKDNHKGYVASVYFFPQKLFHVIRKTVIASQPQAWETSVAASLLQIRKLLELSWCWLTIFFSFSFILLPHSLNLYFFRDSVFQIVFLFCTCCFRLVKCSWIMLDYFHNFDAWEESCPETFSENGANCLVSEDREMRTHRWHEEKFCVRGIGPVCPQISIAI